jgi:hypothetical protein
MSKLTASQLAFIKKMGLYIEDTFDATGLRHKEYKVQMKQLDKRIAYGVTPCEFASHTLRSASGICVQCNPATLAYQKRFLQRGDVYVAWSVSGKLAKVGCAKNSYERLKSLIETEYGGYSDWSLKLIYECEEVGLIEHQAKKILNKFSAQGYTYIRNGKNQKCTELFKCSLRKAKSALSIAVNLR